MRLPPPALSASKPVFWQTATLNDFLRGEVENLSVDGHGRLVLGPATELVAETTSPFLWAMAVAPDGSIYVGSGNEGKVFKIDAAGKTDDVLRHDRARSARARARARRHAVRGDLARRAHLQDRPHAAKARRSSIPKTSTSGASRSTRQGNLYAGTGEKGLIYKITPDGKGSAVLRDEGDARHRADVRAQRAAARGHRGPGRLFRVDTAGKAFLLLDSTFQEIRAIRLDPQGNIYLAALSGRTTSTSQPPAIAPSDDTIVRSAREPVPTVTTEVTAIAVVDTGGASVGSTEAPAREDRRSGRGAIYRIRPDGLWDILWESGEDSPYDLTFDSSGALIVGTGRNGKLYSLSGEPDDGDVADAGVGPAGHRLCARCEGQRHITRRRIPERSSGSRRSARPKAPTRRSCATRRRLPTGAR